MARDRVAGIQVRSSLPARWQKTQAGRVVYARRKHDFSWKDALRVSRAVCIAQVLDPLSWSPSKKATAEMLIERVELTLEFQSGYEDEFTGFGGGEFGGGGATRDDWRRLSSGGK